MAASLSNAGLLPLVKLTSGLMFKPAALGSAYACGVDDIDDVGWFKTTQFFTSPDNVTLTARGLPAGASIGSKLVRFGSYVYVDGLAGGFANLYRSQPPSAGAVSWSTTLLTTAGTSTISTCLNKSVWASGTNYLFFGEYGDPSGGASIWRSPDGTTWTKVLGPVAGLRHFHAIAADPYNAGVVYATAGDGQSKVVYRSTDSGSNWTLIVTDNAFQAVQISFTPAYVWFAGDAHLTAWVMNRTDLVPVIASTNFHGLLPIPGGTGARGPFADGVSTSGSKTFTSATAAFTAADVGRSIRVDTATWQLDYAGGLFITAVTNATTVTLSNNGVGSTTGITFWVDGDRFNQHAFFGAVDPATGIYYAVMVKEDVAAGNRSALLYLPCVGSCFEVLQLLPSGTAGELFFRGSKVWAHQAIQPQLTRAA